jgi:hypothetical protein
MLTVSLFVLLIAIVSTLAVRGAWAIWQSRTKDNGASRETATADTLAALLEGEDDPETTIEERLEALALGLKNVTHTANRLQGRLNKLAPPALKEPPAPPNGEAGRPPTRADLYKQWRSKNAG